PKNTCAASDELSVLRQAQVFDHSERDTVRPENLDLRLDLSRVERSVAGRLELVLQHSQLAAVDQQRRRGGELRGRSEPGQQADDDGADRDNEENEILPPKKSGQLLYHDRYGSDGRGVFAAAAARIVETRSAWRSVHRQ